MTARQEDLLPHRLIKSPCACLISSFRLGVDLILFGANVHPPIQDICRFLRIFLAFGVFMGGFKKSRGGVLGGVALTDTFSRKAKGGVQNPGRGVAYHFKNSLAVPGSAIKAHKKAAHGWIDHPADGFKGPNAPVFLSELPALRRKSPRVGAFSLYHNPVIEVVEVTGFEPAASASRTQRSTKLSHTSIYLAILPYYMCGNSTCQAGVFVYPRSPHLLFNRRRGRVRGKKSPNPRVYGDS